MGRIYNTHIAPTRPPKVEDKELSIIIMAANISYGMKTYGPKSLLTINNKETLLEYQINLLKRVFPQSDILLVVGFKADRIIRRCPVGVRIVENQLFEISNEAEQLRLAFNCMLTNSAIIIKDSIVFNAETLHNISQNGSCIIYDSKNQLEKDDVGVTVVDGCGTIFSYDIPTKWCHIAYLTGRDLKTIKSLCTNRENSKLYLFELLNILLNKTDKIKAIEPINMEIIKVDNSKDWEKLKI